MTRTVLLSIVLIAMTAVGEIHAEIGVITQLQRRSFSLNFEEVRVATGDINGDGLADIVTRSGDSSFVLDAVTLTRLYAFPRRSGDTLRLLMGFFRFNGPAGAVSVAFEEHRDTGRVSLVLRDLLSNGMVFEISGQGSGDPIPTESVSFNFASIRRKNGRDILVLATPKGILVIGEKNGFRNDGGGSTSVSSPTHSAAEYALRLKYEGPAGRRLAFFPRDHRMPRDADLDSDGVPDLILRPDTGTDDPKGMVVVSGNDGSELLNVTFPTALVEALRPGLHGFADVDGDGNKEAIIGRNFAITRDGALHIIADGMFVLGLLDIDGDGLEDVLGIRGRDSTVVAYGKSSTTSVEADPARMPSIVLQPAFPNPFNPTTAIPLVVLEDTPVRMEIMDVRGRLVRVLHDGMMPAGVQVLRWDGTDDGGRSVAAGAYALVARARHTVRAQILVLMK